MKKIFSLLLVLTLAVGLFAGCGKEDFSCSLTPLDADLEYAPNMVVEPDIPPYNLGGWMAEDEAWWYADLPYKGTYTVRIWYSMPGEYDDNLGFLSLIPDEGDIVNRELTFTATSAPGSWADYDYVEVSVILDKGPVALCLEPLELGADQDYFINLRQIDIYTGEAPEGPRQSYVKPVVPEETDPVPDETDEPLPLASGTDASGWWVRPDDYEGFGDINCFFVDGDTWYSYSSFGDVEDSGSCYMEDGELVMETFFGEDRYTLADNQLISFFEVNYVRVGDPGFLEMDLNFDGNWYVNGDVNGESYYKIEGDTYQKIIQSPDGEYVDEEGTFTKNMVRQTVNTIVFPDVLKLNSTVDFGPDFIPSDDGAYFYEDDGFSYEIYVHEYFANPEMVDALNMVGGLMSMTLQAYPEEGIMLDLDFLPYCFMITVYEYDGETAYYATDDIIVGEWEIQDSNYLHLVYADGAEDLVELPEPDTSIWLDHMELEFPLEPFFF